MRAGPTDTLLLRTLDELAHAALDDMRALIFELHPTLLDTHGLVARRARAGGVGQPRAAARR